MFPNGWPGRGLLILRLSLGVFLIQDGVVEFSTNPIRQVILLQTVSVSAGILLMIGFWTPIAGAGVVVLQLWFLMLDVRSVRDCLFSASLGAGLAMLGPGAMSLDARKFGRKRIDILNRHSPTDPPLK